MAERIYPCFRETKMKSYGEVMQIESGRENLNPCDLRIQESGRENLNLCESARFQDCLLSSYERVRGYIAFGSRQRCWARNR